MHNNDFNILIVDDEKPKLEVLNRILHKKYNISIAKSVQAALELIQDDR